MDESALHIALERCAALSVARLTTAVPGRTPRETTDIIIHISASLRLALARPIKFLLTGPSTIFRRILQHLPLNDRILLSHTCRDIRVRCLAELDLWKSIVIAPRFHQASYALILGSDSSPSIQVQYEGALQLLQRSRNLSSCLFTILHIGRGRHHAEAFIKDALSRVSVLRIEPYRKYRLTVVFGEDDRLHIAGAAKLEDWAAFAQSLIVHAPVLKSLQIVIPRDLPFSYGPNQLVLPHHVLAGDPTQLRTCLLSGVRLPLGPSLQCSAFSRLTLFDYDPRYWHTSSEEVDMILLQMPQLATLGLTMAAFQSETVDVTDQVTKGPTHVSLVLEAGHRPVDADAASIQNAVAFFRKRGAVCLELVIRNETPLDDLPRSFPEAFESPTIVVFCDHLATYSSGPFRVSFRFFRQPLPTPNTFRSMVSLTIAEQFWPPPLPAEGPDALRLLRLCIQLRTCWSKPLGMSNPLARHGVFVERLESPWNCPVLEEVEFTFPQRRNCPFARSNSFECICTVSACTMCLRDVREFITSNLRFPTPRLGRVILSGVHAVVDPDPASELIALQAIVDELHVSAAESESSATIGREWEARNSHRWVPTQVFSNAVKFSFDLDDSLGTVPDYFDFYHRA